MTRSAHILLVSPAFHEYWRSIAAGFEALGHRVTTYRYDEHATVPAKAKNKLVYEGLDKIRPEVGSARQSAAATAQARQQLREVHPDVVVVVKGDIFGTAFWDDIERAGLPKILWLYDEIRRTRHTIDRLRRFSMIASYSPLDVAALHQAGIGATHVPLAFDTHYQGHAQKSSNVVFIGARYPKRAELLTELYARSVPVHAYGRDWSHAYRDRLRTWTWMRPEVPASTQVGRKQASEIMAGANATLNIHGDQDGFTMRTFEAAGVGAFQLIDRNDVSVHYSPGEEIVSFEDADGIVEALDHARRDPSWAKKIAQAGRARTLAEHTFVHRAKVLEQLWD